MKYKAGDLMPGRPLWFPSRTLFGHLVSDFQSHPAGWLAISRRNLYLFASRSGLDVRRAYPLLFPIHHCHLSWFQFPHSKPWGV